MTTVDGLYVQQAAEGATFGGPGETQRVFATIVSSTYFELLRIRAAAGRLFAASDFNEASVSRLAVLSHAFWMRQFRGDRAIVGDTIVLNGERFGVIGVAAEGFWGTSVVSADLWLLVGAVPVFGEFATDRRFFTVRDADRGIVGGRLKAGISRAQAAAEVDAISAALEREFPNEYGGRSYLVAGASPIPPSIRILLGGFFAVLLGLVSLVLFVACANVAGVLLARGAARRQEIAVRVAIGAGRTRLVRQMLTETLLLFLAGGLTGLAVARAMTTLLLRLLPVFPVPIALSFPLDERVLAAAGTVTLVAAVLCGLAPALHVAKTDVVTGLKADVQGPSDRVRLRSAFVVAQVTFSIVLIVAAGVLGRAVTTPSRRRSNSTRTSSRPDSMSKRWATPPGPVRCSFAVSANGFDPRPASCRRHSPTRCRSGRRRSVRWKCQVWRRRMEANISRPTGMSSTVTTSPRCGCQSCQAATSRTTRQPRSCPSRPPVYCGRVKPPSESSSNGRRHRPNRLP